MNVELWRVRENARVKKVNEDCCKNGKSALAFGEYKAAAANKWWLRALSVDSVYALSAHVFNG